MKNTAYLVIFLFLVACGSSESSSEQYKAEEVISTQTQNRLITPELFESKMKESNAIVVDVRTPREISQGYIEGAKFIDYSDSDFKSKIQQLDKSKTYLIYCASGGRSNNTYKMMSNMGFTKAFDLKGGIRNWVRSGKKVVK